MKKPLSKAEMAFCLAGAFAGLGICVKCPDLPGNFFVSVIVLAAVGLWAFACLTLVLSLFEGGCL